MFLNVMDSELGDGSGGFPTLLIIRILIVIIIVIVILVIIIVAIIIVIIIVIRVPRWRLLKSSSVNWN